MRAIFFYLVLMTPLCAKVSYSGENGTESWGGECQTGKYQSPINIDTGDVTIEDFPSIEFHYPPTTFKVKNVGYQLKVTPQKGAYITVGGERYDLVQFHSHYPSEHTVNGLHYPIETHFLHQNKAGDIVVLGLFCIEGEPLKAMDTIWEKIDQQTGDRGVYSKDKIDLLSFFPQKSNLFHYKGSSTSPPCIPNVMWYIWERPMQFSKEQIEDFRRFFPANNRPTMPLNGRKVYRSAKPKYISR
ncbi:MAG: Carbonic anhydrase [Chlamydiales bacterium]|nr:Carbonic anhydrase [Chlamydiales bacterium]MCH9620180.1 Carbonic anhydrase [Chlamydiales bacterium]MCH9623105.1 Carbonic anhydrase [Chlamydiales bacterium]